MKIYDDFEIDYEHMDDLPLSEHIEWSHLDADEEIQIGLIEEEEETTLADHLAPLDKFRDFIVHKSNLSTVNSVD